jgi:hypothetical protein
MSLGCLVLVLVTSPNARVVVAVTARPASSVSDLADAALELVDEFEGLITG